MLLVKEAMIGSVSILRLYRKGTEPVPEFRCTLILFTSVHEKHVGNISVVLYVYILCLCG